MASLQCGGAVDPPPGSALSDPYNLGRPSLASCIMHVGSSFWCRDTRLPSMLVSIRTVRRALVTPVRGSRGRIVQFPSLVDSQTHINNTALRGFDLCGYLSRLQVILRRCIGKQVLATISSHSRPRGVVATLKIDRVLTYPVITS